jgi:predicted enzyme related to lactoylglutathione lyase
MSTANLGKFVWHELMTTDTKGAIAFYSEVVGWKTEPFPGGQYTMWASPQGTMGGVNPLPEEAKKMGAPPHWMANVEVADVDATVAKAKELGGQILVAPNDIPTVGRFAVFADPQGAAIAIFKPASQMKLHDSEKPGEFCWAELLANDSAAAFKFYGEVLGWEKVAEHDMGPMGIYLLFGRGSTRFGGMFTKPKDMKQPPAWLYYVQVDKLDEMVERAKAKGAKLLNGPMDVPGGARIAQLMDPQGAAFALHEMKK